MRKITYTSSLNSKSSVLFDDEDSSSSRMQGNFEKKRYVSNYFLFCHILIYDCDLILTFQ